MFEIKHEERLQNGRVLVVRCNEMDKRNVWIAELFEWAEWEREGERFAERLAVLNHSMLQGLLFDKIQGSRTAESLMNTHVTAESIAHKCYLVFGH